MRRVPIIFGGLACAIAVLTGALAQPAAAQDPEAGEAVFRRTGNCFTCHGTQAKGTALAPDLTDTEWVNFDARPTREELEALIKIGVPKPVRHPAPMPPMGGARLSDQQVAQVAAYVLSLSAEDEGGGSR